VVLDPLSNDCGVPSALIGGNGLSNHALTDVAIESRPFGPNVQEYRDQELESVERDFFYRKASVAIARVATLNLHPDVRDFASLGL